MQYIPSCIDNWDPEGNTSARGFNVPISTGPGGNLGLRRRAGSVATQGGCRAAQFFQCLIGGTK